MHSSLDIPADAQAVQMTAPLLQQCIDRFDAFVEEKVASGADPSTFIHFAIRSLKDAQRSVSYSPHQTRALPTGDSAAALRGETHALVAGNGMRLASFTGETPFAYETEANCDHLLVRYVFRGSATYSAGGAIVARAEAGHFTFRLANGPVVTFTTSENYGAFLITLPMPASRRRFLNHVPHFNQYLENGFVVVTQADLWEAHFAYAINYAIDTHSYPDRDIQSEIVIEHLFLLCAQELAGWAQSRDAQQQYKMVPLKLRIAEEFIVANAARAPSIGRVAAAAGATERHLHKLFIKFRGTSPSDFIREQRLLGVRRALQSAKADATVSGIANDWQFNNLGNFAAAYRKRFGELPSATLASTTRRTPTNR